MSSEVERKGHEDLALEVKARSDETTSILENLIQRTKDSTTSNQEGISFLDLKNLMVI